MNYKKKKLFCKKLILQDILFMIRIKLENGYFLLKSKKSFE